MADARGVLVLAEQVDGKLAGISFELLGAGRKLADQMGEPLLAALAGGEAQAQELLAAGADRVYLLEDPALAQFLLDTALPAAEQVIRAASPRVVLLGHTSTGKDLGARLAVRLGVGLASDVTALSYDAASGDVLACKPIFGGLAVSEQAGLGRPQIVTLRPKATEPAQP